MNHQNPNSSDPKFTVRDTPHSTRLFGDDGESDSAGFELVQVDTPKFVEATNRYEILEQLGYGGSGIVYRARDVSLSREVAVKMLRHRFFDRPEFVRRFTDESKIICHLQHPGIAPVYECGTCPDGRPFFAMKLVDGVTMWSLIHKEASDSRHTARLLRIFSFVCQAIAYTHARGVIHGDLKPSNVMVGAFGEVHVMDWGLSQFRDSPKENPKQTGLVRGTVQYMSPEQASGKELTPRSDVFGLGTILLEILTGCPLYIGTNKKDLVVKAANAAYTDAIKRLDACGAEDALVRLTKRCLAPDPDCRPSDAAEVAAEMLTYEHSVLERVESDMTRFFELSLDLFCIAGFDGYFRRINSNFSRVLGYTDTELLASPFLNFVHEDDREDTIKVMNDLMAGKPVVRFQNRYRTTDGKAILFEWTVKSVPRENMIFGVARIVEEDTR
ncbi:MAG: protein kinase domain-containing protein [Pirellulaceae bacterium]